MKCVRCGGFSSTRICWPCSNLPDAVSFLRIEQLERELSAERAARVAAEKDAIKPCEWAEDCEGCWDTSCGNKFFFTDGGIEENGCKFCHYCGHPVKPVKYVEQPLEDEDAAIDAARKGAGEKE